MHIKTPNQLLQLLLYFVVEYDFGRIWGSHSLYLQNECLFSKQFLPKPLSSSFLPLPIYPDGHLRVLLFSLSDFTIWLNLDSVLRCPLGIFWYHSISFPVFHFNLIHWIFFSLFSGYNLQKLSRIHKYYSIFRKKPTLHNFNVLCLTLACLFLAAFSCINTHVFWSIIKGIKLILWV